MQQTELRIAKYNHTFQVLRPTNDINGSEITTIYAKSNFGIWQ